MKQYPLIIEDVSAAWRARAGQYNASHAHARRVLLTSHKERL